MSLYYAAVEVDGQEGVPICESGGVILVEIADAAPCWTLSAGCGLRVVACDIESKPLGDSPRVAAEFANVAGEIDRLLARSPLKREMVADPAQILFTLQRLIAHDIEPTVEVAWAGLTLFSRLSVARGRFSAAVDAERQALAIADTAEARAINLAQLGAYELRAGRNEAAVALMLEAAALAPTWPAIIFLACEVLREAGHGPAAQTLAAASRHFRRPGKPAGEGRRSQATAKEPYPEHAAPVPAALRCQLHEFGAFPSAASAGEVCHVS